MAPKKAPVEEPPPEEAEPAEPPPPVEGDERELESGLKLVLRPNDVGKIWAQSDYASQSQLLTELLGLEVAHPAEARRDIVCDFHLFNLMHAKTLCLTQRQGAVFGTIMALVLDMMAGWPMHAESEGSELPDVPPLRERTFDETVAAPTAAQCFQQYERLLLQHSVNAPPSRLAIFGSSEARLLSDYASTTLFKHALLYQFCARCEREVQTLRFNIDLDRPVVPPDLATAKKKSSRTNTNNTPAADAESGAERQEKTTGDSVQEGPSEEDEIQRIVEEKLQETEARLQAKLEAREDAFRARQGQEAGGA